MQSQAYNKVSHSVNLSVKSRPLLHSSPVISSVHFWATITQLRQDEDGWSIKLEIPFNRWCPVSPLFIWHKDSFSMFFSWYAWELVAQIKHHRRSPYSIFRTYRLNDLERWKSVYYLFMISCFMFVTSAGIQQLLGISPSRLCGVCPDPALTLKGSGK